MLWTREEVEELYKRGQIDVSEYRARLKGLRKGWSEEKTMCRANLRRYSKKFGLGLANIVLGGMFSKR